MGKAAQTIHIIITYKPFGVVISLMISDTDYFYIWQLFTFIFFLFQAVNCFMISDAYQYLSNVL